MDLNEVIAKTGPMAWLPPNRTELRQFLSGKPIAADENYQDHVARDGSIVIRRAERWRYEDGDGGGTWLVAT